MPPMTPLALSLTGPGVVLAFAAAAVLVLMLAVWLLSIRRQDVSIIDPVWGPALALVGVVAAIAGDGDGGRRWLLAAMVVAWGARLGWHLAVRKAHEPEEDRRYAKMREQHENFNLWSLVWIFGTQGLLVLLVSLPLQAAAQGSPELGLLVVPGVSSGRWAWPSRRSATRSCGPSRPTRRRRARSWTKACGTTRATRTTSATRACGGGLAGGADRRRHLVDLRRAVGDDRPARPGLGRRAAGEGHRRAPPGLQGVRRAHVAASSRCRRKSTSTS